VLRRAKELWSRLEPGPTRLNVKAEREAVDYVDQPAARLEQGRDTRKRAEVRRGFVAKKESKLLEEARGSIDSTMAPADDAMRLLRTLTTASLLLLTLGVPLQVVVNMIAIPSLTGWRLWAASIVIDLGLAAFTKAAALAAFRDPIRPRLVTKRCLTGAAATGSICGLALTLLALSRTALGSMATLLLDIVPACLWILAEGSPITAGFLLAAMEILAAPFDRDREIAELQAEDAELRELLGWLEDDQERCKVRFGSTSRFEGRSGSGNGSGLGQPTQAQTVPMPGAEFPARSEGR